MTQKRPIRQTLLFLVSGLLLVAAYFVYLNEKPGLRMEIEGLYLDTNFRDLGATINTCLNGSGISARLKENMMFRSNKWFSGWSCNSLGNPDSIITLNYQPDKKWQYYCKQKDGEPIVGFNANAKVEINNIEFLNTWQDKVQKHAICSNLDVIFHSVMENKRTLFHCEAGRDRTGAIAAIITALIFEMNSIPLNDEAVAAIECDYRKSLSLKSHKYGRMSHFISEVISQYGGMKEFLMQQCQFPEDVLMSFTHDMIQKP